LDLKQYFAKAERREFFCKLILFEFMSKEFSGTIITKGSFEIKGNEMFLLLFLAVDGLKQTQAAEYFAVYFDKDHTCCVHLHLYVHDNGKTCGSNRNTSWNKTHICMQILFYLICTETSCVANPPLRKLFIRPTYSTAILCWHWK
jgi:hypothetical protein